MSVFPVFIPIDSGPSPDYREWICRRCHEWCKTIGPATYCPHCGRDTLDEKPSGPPWSLRKKLIVWGCLAVGVFVLYILLARFSTELFDSYPRWWPFRSML